MNALLMDNLQGVRQIKAFGRQDHEDERFRERADGLRRSTLSVMKVWAAYSPAMTFAGSLGMVLVLWVGGPMVVDGTMTLGGLVGFIFYLTLFYQPIGRLDGLNQMLQSARAASDRSSISLMPGMSSRDGPHRPAEDARPGRGTLRQGEFQL